MVSKEVPVGQGGAARSGNRPQPSEKTSPEQGGIRPNEFETFFLTTGNAYRWAASHGGLGNWFMGAGTLLPPPIIIIANPAYLKLGGDWFNSPLSVDPVKGMSPVYWFSSAIWEVQAWYSD